MKKRIFVSVLVVFVMCALFVTGVSAWYQNITLQTYMQSVQSSWSASSKSIYFSYLNSGSSGAAEVFVDDKIGNIVTNIFYSEAVTPGEYDNFTFAYGNYFTYQMMIKRFSSGISAYAIGYMQTP